MVLRNITKGDIKLLYNWANEFEVRDNAISNNNITFSSHLKWFKSKIESPTSHIFILMHENQPIGQIRFDKVDNYYEIDYSIDKKYRGKGYGGLIVKKGMSKIKKIIYPLKIKAIVKESNIKSEKVFCKLEFEFKEVLENGFKVFTYEYNK